MSWLDRFLNIGYATIAVAGVALPQQRTVNFSAGVSAVDNPLFGRTDVTITTTSPGGPAGGDLAGTFPNPTVRQISDPGGGNPVELFAEKFRQTVSDTTVISSTEQILTEDDDNDVIYTIPTGINTVTRFVALIVAVHAGNGVGLGCIVDSWSVSALVTRDPSDSTAALIVSTDISAAMGSSGWTGPSLDVDSTNVEVRVSGSPSAGTIHWSITQQYISRF